MPAVIARPSGLRFIVTLVAVFSALQAAMIASDDTPISRFLIDQATVRVATAIIDQVFPNDGARAEGSTIVSSRVRMSVLRGCEGTEILFLVIAASVALPAMWRARAVALAGGLVLAYALNQLRVLALYYTVRDAREWFELVHGYLAPTFLIVAVALFFWWWTARRRPNIPPSAPQ